MKNIFLFCFLTIFSNWSYNAQSQSNNIPVKNYNLVWADEFNASKTDTTWKSRGTGYRGGHGGFVDPEQFRNNNKGYLELVISKDTINGNSTYPVIYRTAMITTYGARSFKYGYFETKMYISDQPGINSSFWLQSPKYPEGTGCPAKYGTEIDIFETMYGFKKFPHHTLHWDGYAEEHKMKGKMFKKRDMIGKWHTIGLEWTEKYYAFYIDGKRTWKTRKAISKIPQFIILSAEIKQNIEHAVLPSFIKYDYVRVYQKNK